ncbi:hypothetical protein [Rufibacter latericius]|nr:hypothetical protein [Rufibacter latericius]
MKINFLLALATLCTASIFALPVVAQDLNTGVTSEFIQKEAPVAAATVKTDLAANLVSEEALSQPMPSETGDFQGQDKPRQTRKGDKQEVKEVATAKRQQKPRKVSEDAGQVTRGGFAGRPQSAARPGRGAAGSAAKVTGKVTKTVKAAKPVKVGGVGVGRIKVGKN